MIEEALRLALNSHWGQKDKVGQPYILHPLRIMGLLSGDEKLASVAILHDVLEDTECTVKELAFLPDDVIEAIIDITKLKGEDYKDYLHRVAKNSLAKTVKYFDINDNVKRIHNIKDSKERRRLEKKYQIAMDIIY